MRCSKFASVLVLFMTYSAVPVAHAYNVDRQVFCVAEGTNVTLSDGSSKTIETIAEEDWILTATGKSLPTLMKVRGPEKQYFYTLTLASGKSVTATADHPFIHAESFVITPEEMSVGMPLLTLNGADEVVSIARVPADQKVFTLVLTNPDLLAKADRSRSVQIEGGALDWRQLLRRQDPFLGLSSAEHTFYANGIASGDGVIQGGIKR